jgi:hypothetical protein
MKCVKFIGLDGKKYAIACSDYKIVEISENDRRIYYVQCGRLLMDRFSSIFFECDNYVPGT